MENVFTLGIQDAAKALGISPWTVRKYVWDGRIRATRIGRRVTISVKELQRIAEEGIRNAA
ncbi:MAG: helix-turn-helix domain-containing protein [Acidobacteriia bacterium]|nr:helix-turn-helix domain-containing protein [Terriglobia bacterium]